MMKFTAKDIANFLNGEVIGNPDKVITGLSDIMNAKESDISFISNKKYEKYVKDSAVGIIIVDKDFDTSKYEEKTFVIVENSYAALRMVLEQIEKFTKIQKSGISPKAIISDSAIIGENAYIGPNVTIDDDAQIGDNAFIEAGTYVGCKVKLGNNVRLRPNVTILENCDLGNNVIIHSGTVIGSDGFGYVFEGGKHIKLPQIGKVIIEDNVEIGSNVSIDRATFDATVIGAGTKIDNLVQLAHNVKVGKNSIIVAQVGVAGSTEIGDYVVIGGQVGIVGHIKIGNQAKIGAKAGVMNDIPDGEIFSGAPARPHKDFLRLNAKFNKMLREKKGGANK